MTLKGCSSDAGDNTMRVAEGVRCAVGMHRRALQPAQT
jgi:hypothetical protein